MGINTPGDGGDNSPANIAPHIGVQDFLDMADMKLEDFDGKCIADVAGGAGLLSLYIQNNAKPAHIVLVDPELKNKSFEQMVKRSKGTFELFSQAPAGLPKFEQELADATQKANDAAYGIMKDLEMEKKKKEDFVTKIKDRMKKLKDAADIMDKYLIGEYKGVELNDSSGEHIVGVESNSQDIVFINHILCKLPDVYYQMLQEADRILKPDGEIIIIDYPHYDVNGENDYFRKLCDEKKVITKESAESMCIKLKKGEYVKMK